MSERTDEEVVAAWQSGDERAFDEVVDRFTRRVFGICHRYFGEATDAEEATQETFVTLYRRGSSFRGQSRFSTWLYRVATNVCHDIGRKRARRVDTVPLDERPGGAPGEQTPSTDAEDALVAAELGAEITTALRGLDIDQRTAVVLRDVCGLGYEEVARRTDVAVGTAKSRVHRAHARLASELGHLRDASASGRERSGRDEHLT